MSLRSSQGFYFGQVYSFDDEAAKVKRNDGKKACVRWMENVKMTDILG